MLSDATNLAIPVRHMATVSLAQCPNDITQTTERLVDTLRFLQALTLSLRVAESLAASKIDEVERSFALLASDAILAGQSKDENGMTSTGPLIRLRSCHAPVPVSASQDFVHTFRRIEFHCLYVCNCGLAVRRVVNDSVLLLVKILGFPK